VVVELAVRAGAVHDRIHVTAPSWISYRSATARLSWTRPTASPGHARLTLFAVQSGSEPITELVLAFDLPGDETAATSAKATARSALDELASGLTRSA
jgi:hypothetical protein